MPNAAQTGFGVVVTTLFGSSFLAPPTPPPFPDEPIRLDSALLSTWTSEQIVSNSDEPLDGECAFFNFSRVYASDFCDPFSISRMQVHTIRAASERALKCAAKHSIECVLSAEVGFSVPAAFVAQHGESDDMLTVIAPRIVQEHGISEKQEYVRIHPPGSSTFDSRTIRLNTSVTVEYMSAAKRVETRVLTDSSAFCVQLLRLAFDSACWAELDRV